MPHPDPSTDRGESSERWLAIVPTLGRSELLADSVAGLRREGGRVVVVAPRGSALPASWSADGGVEVVSTDGALGFAAANLAGLDDAPQTEFVALVNDDAIVEDGWATALLAELDAHPRCAAAQGVVLTMDEDPDVVVGSRIDGSRIDGARVDGARVDGAGLAWNGWWQAVQIGHGESAGLLPGESAEIFGASATAAIFRRSALDSVGPLFDTALGSYYEDVDLAVRLRAAGWSARLVPSARARHAGSTTGRHLGAARLVRRNRYAVLARALGGSVWLRLPKIVLRDLVDAIRALFAGEASTAAAVFSGTVSGLFRLPRSLRGRGLLSADALRRWTSPGSGR